MATRPHHQIKEIGMDLKNDNDLRKAINQVLTDPDSTEWISELADFLEKIRAADLDTRASREFHQMIWEDSAVSDVGMGTVNISAALDDTAFRRWVAEESLKPLPQGKEAQEAHIQAFFNQLAVRVAQFSDRRPLVKILRVMAAFFPRHFTTVAANSRAIECHRALMGRAPKLGPVKYQLDITQRLAEVLGEVDDEPKALAERMTIPWRLFVNVLQKGSESAAIEEEVSPGQVKLKPLPALQRRKGLTSINGGIASIISAISFVENGVAKEELMDHLRSEFPDYRESSLNTLFNILKNEFFVIQQDGDIISSTSRGAAFLETNDPEELVPVLITRILGFDNALWFLKQKQTATGGELMALLQSVNPGWTSKFAPAALVKWLRDFGLISLQNQAQYILTERGHYWANQIYWEPERLGKEEEIEVFVLSVVASSFDIRTVDFSKVVESVQRDSAFFFSLIHQLHCGLWSHPRRHFAIMAGLSGSGKTLLAKRYAQAIIEQFGVKPETNLFIQAVQPGWYDPTPLFGYVNPLSGGNYRRPAMLDVLLRANQHPDQPFIIILDEMNLSHPEQYFAPVLSAMESGDPLRLHNEGPSFDGVPNLIPYPTNVAFIGTVNMDETTHGISDKVLDRAFTLEFWDINLAHYPNWNSRSLDQSVVNLIRECLQDLLDALSPVRLHFGWRTVDDILDYVCLARKSSPTIDIHNALDEVIYARVLPKLRGTETARLRSALEMLIEALKRHGLKKSLAKVGQLKVDLADSGIMRFWR
jgi:5-methylcytosine-specific restriction protein B